MSVHSTSSTAMRQRSVRRPCCCSVRVSCCLPAWKDCMRVMPGLERLPAADSVKAPAQGMSQGVKGHTWQVCATAQNNPRHITTDATATTGLSIIHQSLHRQTASAAGRRGGGECGCAQSTSQATHLRWQAWRLCAWLTATRSAARASCWALRPRARAAGCRCWPWDATACGIRSPLPQCLPQMRQNHDE